MFLKPKIAAKESNVEVWDYKLFNGRQLLSPSEKSPPCGALIKNCFLLLC